MNCPDMMKEAVDVRVVAAVDGDSNSMPAPAEAFDGMVLEVEQQASVQHIVWAHHSMVAQPDVPADCLDTLTWEAVD